ncbi:uncharacterized protein LOC9633323 isoform X2 [Selaginella moellendorffii]|uniref:uncharacterized protein LOC9633323 isoform X2 n=1 Tax=Selaginella moellendorffii TaxID=88036 RepID=UPI000D1C3441|nr:uncharacterized protein LOC9633323 isoform X2 [Selaginella moellendorffii]|eukprot:XP_024528559.1 uncharacterized protein LOC9633323 isoform X2 [Selaginella moellendorffii]
MESGRDRALLLALAVAGGFAAGTAAAMTATTFPYLFGAAFAALRSKRKRELREHRHRYKSDKVKRLSGKPKEGKAYRDAIRKSIAEWKDIDVELDNFPYFLNESTKTALLDSLYVYLKRPEFVKFTSELASVSPRILLTGPPGSEIFQETLVKALAQKLQVNLLIFDSASICLEANELTPEPVSVSEETVESDEVTIQIVDGENVDTKEVLQDGVNGVAPPSMLDTVPQENSKAPKSVSSPTRTKTSEAVELSLPSSRSKDQAKDLATSLMSAGGATTQVVESSRRALKKGDRVKFAGPTCPATPSGLAVLVSGSSNGKGPSIGARGRVLLVLEDNPSKVGVRFDKPVYGGNNLVDLCEDGHGYFCNVSELRLEHSSGEDVDKLILDSLIEVLVSEASKVPLILLIKNVEKSIMGNFERYMKLERLEKADVKLVIIGSHTSDHHKDKGSSGSYHSNSKMGNNFTAFLDMSLLDHLSTRAEDYKPDGSKCSRMLAKLFPSKIYVQQPQDENMLLVWNRQLEQDAERLKAEANRQLLRIIMSTSNVECNDLSTINIQTHLLTHDMAEKVVGWGISHHLQHHVEPLHRNGKIVIKAESLEHSLAELQAIQRGSTQRKKTLKDVVCDNEFEKILLPEVIPPDEIRVTFDHIGALDNVKETLRELVMLPLQRPELFVKGQLTKPCRGLLLFGPPGTGKTMLAKAVATEAGANFINISMSTIASKWFGEAEKYVKAVFTLASKISPSVVFVDEVDSMLGRRGKDHEHSAMRKLKNEFMASWDGLRTREKERVIVLAATNRPFDLDEAVIRRFPRRLMIDVPDAENRAKILKVILSDEDLSPDFNMEEVAAAADGYSGSDLKNLCTTAAYIRIRELLEQEKKEMEKAKAQGVEKPAAPTGVTPYIRPISMADMRHAMEKVRSSVSSDAGIMGELQQWNEQYGEGGTRKKATLTYFM